MKKVYLCYKVPADPWKKDISQLKEDGYKPIPSTVAKKYMKQIANIMVKNGWCPSIYYGMSDVSNDLIGGLHISEGFESDGSSYSIDLEFKKDGIYVFDEFCYELEKASLEEVYEYFEEFKE